VGTDTVRTTDDTWDPDPINPDGKTGENLHGIARTVEMDPEADPLLVPLETVMDAENQVTFELTVPEGTTPFKGTTNPGTTDPHLLLPQDPDLSRSSGRYKAKP